VVCQPVDLTLASALELFPISPLIDVETLRWQEFQILLSGGSRRTSAVWLSLKFDVYSRANRSFESVVHTCVYGDGPDSHVRF
jgi:hypothetical protein